jgi:fructose-bisphosphate aldolase, class I
MSTTELSQTIVELTSFGKGILAADESSGTIEKRFKAVNVPSTEENRRNYREILFSTPGLNQFIAGVILFEETLRQKTEAGIPLPQLLAAQGIVPGIKVDKGTVALAHFAGDKITQGLDGLAERLAEYKGLGARFAKWRAVISIGNGLPSIRAIKANADALARYAAICQEAGIVPIVEPEVLMDGSHTLEACASISEETFASVTHALHQHHVSFEYMLLKPNMVIPGKDCPTQATPEEIACATLNCLRRTIPAAVPSINFLSGGQTDEQATANLNAMNAWPEKQPWQLSFSYGRALQAVVLKAWRGEAANKAAAQQALYQRAQLNSAAQQGKYSSEMEAAA